ncbi:hypothetical protein QFZ40_001081 [Arthrobacter pascens]|uniref:hypothetical protein n=1 Tax=Arthrobacter pascens TaxID=1677 RepID=UPI00278059E4|nr:hypothetical protein [Arthrobacter pascens]MDQ0633172.1 hypothetical protein [Arthrobacter pascens]
MRKSAKLITALSVAGLIGIAGSAFTAASGIDQNNKIVGAVSQGISGVNVSSVEYTVGTGDTTTGVAFHVTQDLAATPATVKATIGNGTTSQTATCDPTPNVGGGTDLSCTFTGVTDVRTLSIVAS